MDRDRIRSHITGPIVSINTPFDADGAIDYEGLARFLDFVIEAGTRTILFTPGDSLYVVLTEKEFADLTDFTAKHINGRALFLAAAHNWWTGKAVEFAAFANQVGADAMLAVPPFRDATKRDFVDYYATLSKEIPVIVLSAGVSVFGVKGALEIIEMLRDEVDGVVGFKEDFCPEFARKACLLVRGKWSVFAGGQKQTHMDMHPYGCDAYMSVFMTFRPEIAHTYWNAIQQNDINAAVEIIRDYDMPVFDLMYSDFDAGGDAAQHAILEMVGLCKRWRRKPLPSFNDEDMERLKTALREKKLLEI